MTQKANNKIDLYHGGEKVEITVTLEIMGAKIEVVADFEILASLDLEQLIESLDED